MDTPPTAKNWRLNAAAIIMDAEGCVLLGKDSGRNPYWHFPQGGVIKHESIEQTLAREVWEEVGLRPTEYTIVSRLPGLRYKYPSNNRKVTRWIGQEQTYFLVRCKTRRPKTDLHRSPEFSKTKWIPLQNLKLEMFPEIQKESHQKRPSAILRARLSFQTCRCENIFPLLTLIFNTNFAYDEPLPGASGQKTAFKGLFSG